MFTDPKMFGFFTPIVEGAGIHKELGDRLKKMGATKILIVHDKNLKDLGLVDKITAVLDEAGLPWVNFDKVFPNPTTDLVHEAGEFAHANKIDGIVAFGGGSTIDVAKGVDILMTNPAPIQQYFPLGKQFNVGVPFVAIPTTSGTGSEVTAMGTIINVEENPPSKRAIWPVPGKRIAMVDPEFMTGLPAGLTAACGLDAMAHAVESFTSRLDTPTADSLAFAAIRDINKYLPICVSDPKNIVARGKVAHAATIAGLAFTNSPCSLGHAMAEPIGVKFNLPHGNCCAATLPGHIEYVSEFVPEKVREIAAALELDVPAGLDGKELGKFVSDYVRKLRKDLGLNGLCEGPKAVDEKELVNKEFAAYVASNYSMKFTPGFPAKEVNADDVLKILKDAAHF